MTILAPIAFGAGEPEKLVGALAIVGLLGVMVWRIWRRWTKSPATPDPWDD